MYFAVSIAGTLISLAQLLAGGIPLTPAQQAYFDNLGPTDYIGGAMTLCLSSWAALDLFYLRKRVVKTLTTVLVLNLGASLYQLIATNWSAALGVTGLAGVAAGLSLLAIILIYAWTLQRRGVLS
ncbi:MAG: hypothetical protein ND807_15160 [Vicinamibacterales bacterium]|nr:hypothetical protein [Vicinamibacterales bacterium]